MSKIPAQLLDLIDEGIIDDVLTRLLTGKEASVFIVERDGMAFAAKVYKARNERSFKNVAAYMDGRNQTRNTRDKRAKNKKTRYGRQLLEESWREMEYVALQRAFNGGVRVPQPHLLMNDVLLMDLVVDEHGDPASRLADFELPPEVAGLLFQEAFLQVRRLLQAGLIHGDLSAFNILVAAEGLTLIDLPQVIEAASNRDAKSLLIRDLKSLVEHLARFDEGLLQYINCGEALWRHFEKGTLDTPEAAIPRPAEARHRRGKGRGRRGRAGKGQGPRANKSKATKAAKPAKPAKPGGPVVERMGESPTPPTKSAGQSAGSSDAQSKPGKKRSRPKRKSGPQNENAQSRGRGKNPRSGRGQRHR
jgi:RIO kinase 1